jgi:hypothetical protein
VIEVTALMKTGGPLTKRISLSPDGMLHSDGSACIMSEGAARRAKFRNLLEFADYISGLGSREAIALGALHRNLPKTVRIVTKQRLEKLNGTANPDTIARTGDYITYERGCATLALIDVDTKGMPPAVSARIRALGGFWPALVSVLPELSDTGRVVRKSTTTGISRADTGETLLGSNGRHIFLLVQDGADVERFLRTLHDRCWLAGLGWMMVGAGGQLLERSIVDRMVFAPERLVFEGTPILVAPLVQDRASRQAEVFEGAALDTMSACRPLRIVERAKLAELRAQDTYRLAPDRANARDGFIADQAARIAERNGITAVAARYVVERQCSGLLLSEVTLPFDAAELDGCTVGDVLADPERFFGATLADPLEGPDYGRGKAKIMRRADGTPWINSFAHGRTVYELKHSAIKVEAILANTEDARIVETFVRLAAKADITPPEMERLRDIVAKRAHSGKRSIDRAVGASRKQQAEQQQNEERERLAAERRDPRPQIASPAQDAPWLPQMEVLNDILGKSLAAEPPMRDASGSVVQVRLRSAPDMHALTALGANDGETDQSRLPAPDHPLLTKLDEVQLSEMIEQHVDYVDAIGRSVHLATPFVRHFLIRDDGALPVVTSVATLPMVMPNGVILSGSGLNRDRGIVFRVPPRLQALLPAISECGQSAVAEAMRFLTDVWLCDVAADYAGKCVMIAAAASILERLLLPERPAFFISAGQRGGGKTTAANMLSQAMLGCRAPAAAWSPSDEERRKALLAYLGEGVPLICWDNIPRGATISCPSIEKALTAEMYTDRVLGASEFRSVPASAIHLFTGNNITPRGDLASRALTARLAVDRPDPENRPFRHPDPLGWTEANRGRILSALYTVLLGNPRLRARDPSPPQTRFKGWWHLVGSAIEYAAGQHAESVSFRAMLQAGETGDEQTGALATVLQVLAERWPAGFKAAEASFFAGAASETSVEFKTALEQASGKAIKVVTPTIITWRLKAIADAPVEIDGRVVALRYMPDANGNGGTFLVREIRG